MAEPEIQTTDPGGGARRPEHRPLDPSKFCDPEVTADGARRAFVEIDRLETLWFNTGTLCNIECLNCYIESSPANDRLEYISRGEVASYLDEIDEIDLPVREIGFTGGEPFVNPDFPDILGNVLARGFEVLILTNAMRPMMRPQVVARLLQLHESYGTQLHLRVSLDHFTAELHETERGPGSWASALEGLRWLARNGFRISVAGRTCWGMTDSDTRSGYRELFDREGIDLPCNDPGRLVLFPEMDASVDVPEITVDCWQILGISPSDMMCAQSRMVVKRRGSETPSVLACTLLPYDEQFELGRTLGESLEPIKLNHPHCSKFCVLGGGSCSVG